MKISQTSDYELIAILNKPVHDLHYSLYPKHFKEYDYNSAREEFRKLINKDHFIFLLVKDCQQAVGYAWLEIREYPENAFKKAYRSLYVHQLSINSTHRKKGYGNKLMNYIYSVAKEKETDRIELDYWFNNNIADEFYEKQGFVKYREIVWQSL